MVTQEAQSVKTKDQLRQECLQMILAQEIEPFFIRPHLNREFIIGLIGMRGDGKSGSGASIALVDFGIRGIPIWSNMAINCNWDIDDDTAREYGLNKGGTVHIESKEIDKWKLLDLDEGYANSFIWVDEINVGYSNVRRTQANTNVDFNIVVQELRKFHSSLGYSVIDEMFIDPELRSLTDVFLKSEDTALSVDGLSVRKPTGLDFKWNVYPMTGYLVGRENSYPVTHKALPPVYFHFKNFHGIYNTNKFQRKGVYTMSTRDKEKMNAELEAEESEGTKEQYNKWGWLEEKAKALKESGRTEIYSNELWDYLDLAGRGLTPPRVQGVLGMYGIRREPNANAYRIENWHVGD